MLLKFFRYTGKAQVSMQLSAALQAAGLIEAPDLEYCFNVGTSATLSNDELQRLAWVLRETFEPGNFSERSFFTDKPTIAEVGPRLNFETSYSTTAVEIMRGRANIPKIVRLERSRRFCFDSSLTEEQIEQFLEPLYDRMTEVRYREPLTTFYESFEIEPMCVIDVLSEDWRENLSAYSIEAGLGWGDADYDFARWLGKEVEKRNLTGDELFGLGQANSSHSRHWEFGGILIIDGEQKPRSLMQMIQSPWQRNKANSLIGFHDDASSIRGRKIAMLMPENPLGPSRYVVVYRTINPTLTAETHNHPSMIAPGPGQATELGGVERDRMCPGRGGRIGICGSGQATGNWHIPGYERPWEVGDWTTPPNIATPLQVALRGSDGIFDYGNAFGVPCVMGFFRTFGMELPDASYSSWFKPVAYGVSGGSIDSAHAAKHAPEEGMLLTLVGGPGYRIGVGGGSASSMLGGLNSPGLDFKSVQRGDPYEENGLNRVVLAGIELLDENPFESWHDLGAGGLINAGPEIVNPVGGEVDNSEIPVGDPSLSTLEKAGNESQERNIALVRKENSQVVDALGAREGVRVAHIGRVTGSGRFVMKNKDGSTPINLPLAETLGKLPPRTFRDNRIVPVLRPLTLPANLSVESALERVLTLPGVASKQWLTRKCDRSVTGLVAQQQCVGPNHLPVADFAIKADSYLEVSGTAYALGEQPNLGFLSPQAMVRRAVTEALLNLIGARVSALSDIKGSTNWMLAFKLPGQAAWLYDAMVALEAFMIELGIASDGGKDSMSMAVKARSLFGEEALVASPKQFVFAPYVTMANVRSKATPYMAQSTSLLYVDLGQGKNRLGGSALAQVYKQIGEQSPDMEDAKLLARTFNTTQSLLDRKLISAIHDRSDGGLITTMFEMGACSNLGVDVWLDSDADVLPSLFSEEPGTVIGCSRSKTRFVVELLRDAGVPVIQIGETRPDHKFRVMRGSQEVFGQSIFEMRATWEEQSYQMDSLQRDPETVEQEKRNTINLSTPPPYKLTYRPTVTPRAWFKKPPRIAVAREKGSNGEREQANWFRQAGFEVVDVHMNDLHSGKITLEDFRGFVPVGGFAQMDVFDAGKGWAAGIKFGLREQFERFRLRPDTFSLGVCNGAQLTLLLGWVADLGLASEQQPRFIQNRSRKFRSGFPTVTFLPSPAVALREMEGSSFGVWVAHGEGYYHADTAVTEQVVARGLAPIRYVGPNGEPTEENPFNPNGSPLGITGLCSQDGRHLAMMPHGERSCIPWQWAWTPRDWKFKVSPWMKLTQNLRQWCDETR